MKDCYVDGSGWWKARDKVPSAGALRMPAEVSSQSADPSLSLLWRLVR